MVDTPGLAVTIRQSQSWQFEGLLASRAQEFAMRYMLAKPLSERQPFAVLVERCAPEHIGLGVGTQLGLAVAKGLAMAGGQRESSATELAKLIGRGERSAIGVHGFEHGGLLVEAGKREGETISPLIERVALPSDWRVVLLTPARSSCWYGERERRAFACAAAGQPDQLRWLAQEVILPTAAQGDLRRFGEAVYEFNRLAGEPFTRVQGGIYASAEIEELIHSLRQYGIAAVGQSSWGPTVFAIVEDSDRALSLALRYRERVRVVVSRVSVGHQVGE
jgi:beta-RFAP synthase